MITLNPKFNKHQSKFMKDLDTKLLHLSSGFGGGKTYALIWKMLHLSKLNKMAHGGFMAPSLVEFKKDVLPLAEEIFEEYKIPYIYNKQDNFFQFPAWTKRKVFVVSGEKKIRGPNWGWACINELTLCPLVRYKEVIGRVRVKQAKYRQVASSGTPEGMANEYYEYLIESKRKNVRIIYGDTRDNLHNMDESYVENLEDSYDSIMQDAYIRGLWVNMSGNRFYYAYDPNKNDDKNIKSAPYSTIHVSLDFNVDKMCANCWNFDGVKLTAFDQVILKKNADTRKMVQALNARGYTPDNTIIYPDPAGNARSTKGKPDIKILEAADYECRVKLAAPRMRTRQLNVNNLLEKGIIKINPDKCKDLKKDLMAVEQNPITLEKDKKNPQLTHSSDGMDYMTDILFPFSGKRKKSTVEDYR